MVHLRSYKVEAVSKKMGLQLQIMKASAKKQKETNLKNEWCLEHKSYTYLSVRTWVARKNF